MRGVTLPGEAADWVAQIEDRRNAGVEHHRALVADAEMTIAFLGGAQDTKYSWRDGIQRVYDEDDDIAPPEIDNRMQPQFKRWLGYFFNEKPVITCFEGGHELRDAETAAVASDFCDFWMANNGWMTTRRKATMWAGVSGIGYYLPQWKAYAHRRRKRRKAKMSTKPWRTTSGRVSFLDHVEEDVQDFDVAVDWLNPLTTYLYPLDADDWSKVTMIISLDVLNAEQIKGRFGKRVEVCNIDPIARDRINFQVLDRLNRFVSADFGYRANPKQHEDRYLVTYVWQRPNDEYRNGRYTILVGKHVVRDGWLPYIEEAREIDPLDVENITMGVIPQFGMDFPGRLIPPAPVGQWRGPQIRWNELLTDQRRNRKATIRNKLVIEKDSMQGDALTATHAEVVEVEPGTTVMPHYFQGQPLAGIEAEKAGVLASLEEMTGQTPVLRGQNPAQVRAAHQLDVLREEALSLVFADIDQAERAHELTARFLLAIARRRYKPERIVQIVGKDRAGAALSFGRANINADIRVKTGSMRPRNHALREWKLTELLRDGAFTDPQTGKINIEMFWEMSELGTMNRSVDARKAQRNRARFEGVAMLLYRQVVKPYDHEDDELHIEEHLATMARPEWYDASMEVQALMITHIEIHRHAAVMAAAPEALIAPPVTGEYDITGGLGGNGTPRAMNMSPAAGGPGRGGEAAALLRAS